MLFLFVLEPLACLIHACPNIAGISIGGGSLLNVVKYADDTTLHLNSRGELAEAERLLTTYENGIGAKISAEKTELLPLVLLRQQVADFRFSQRHNPYEDRGRCRTSLTLVAGDQEVTSLPHFPATQHLENQKLLINSSSHPEDPNPSVLVSRMSIHWLSGLVLGRAECWWVRSILGSGRTRSSNSPSPNPAPSPSFPRK